VVSSTIGNWLLPDQLGKLGGQSVVKFGSYTGSYGQVRGDWTIDRATAFAVEVVHFAIGDALRNAGTHDSNYIGVEIKRGW
jgi:hypothetical protein